MADFPDNSRALNTFSPICISWRGEKEKELICLNVCGY